MVSIWVPAMHGCGWFVASEGKGTLSRVTVLYGNVWCGSGMPYDIIRGGMDFN